MNTFRRLALVAAVVGAAACSSPTTTADEGHIATPQPSFENGTTTAADSGASRNGGNLMGGN